MKYFAWKIALRQKSWWKPKELEKTKEILKKTKKRLERPKKHQKSRTSGKKQKTSKKMHYIEWIKNRFFRFSSLDFHTKLAPIFDAHNSGWNANFDLKLYLNYKVSLPTPWKTFCQYFVWKCNGGVLKLLQGGVRNLCLLEPTTYENSDNKWKNAMKIADKSQEFHVM